MYEWQWKWKNLLAERRAEEGERVQVHRDNYGKQWRFRRDGAAGEEYLQSFDRRVPAKVKGKVYKTVVRPSMLYGLEMTALTKKQEAELEVTELKMLRFSLGVTRMDKIKNEYIQGTAHVKCFGDKTRGQD